jgi:signal transduction histidine kinase
MFVPAVHPRFDAVFRQLPFTGFFFISVFVLSLHVENIATVPEFWWGVSVGIAASVLSLFSTKLVSDGDSWVSIVPILDYVALALICVVQPEAYLTPMILLSVIPALWLGSIEKTYGFVIVIVMSFLSMLPSAFFHLSEHNSHFSIGEVLTLLLMPTFSAVAAGTIHSMTLRSSMKEKALLYQEARLESTVQQERDSNRLLDSIIKAVGRGLFVIDQNGEEILVNKLMRTHPLLVNTTLKFSELEKHGWFYRADKTTPLQPGEGPAARSLNRESFTASLYWVGDPATDVKYAISITSRPLLEADGSFHGAVIALQDVTNFMNALEAKDTFISTVSHELRTPLTSITGYLELIRDEEVSLSPEVVHYLDVAERNTQRLLLLVTDLLTVARSEKGEMPLEKSPTDLGQIVDEAVKAFEKPAADKNISLTREGLAAGEATVDAVRIAQVVENLLSNAIKYTPADGLVRVMLREARSHGSYEIVVKDSGMGIPIEEQSQLFTKFYRALAVRNGSIPGMGLGLSICQKIVESHGGQLNLESVPGQGTTVTVVLPITP